MDGLFRLYGIDIRPAVNVACVVWGRILRKAWQSWAAAGQLRQHTCLRLPVHRCMLILVVALCISTGIGAAFVESRKPPVTLCHRTAGAENAQIAHAAYRSHQLQRVWD